MQKAEPSDERLDDLLSVVQTMFGGSADSVIADSPPLCDRDIEVCVCNAVPVGGQMRVTCDHGWVTLEGDSQPWTDIERVTLAIPGVRGLSRHIRPRVVRPRRIRV
jgi:hypothetical protein